MHDLIVSFLYRTLDGGVRVTPKVTQRQHFRHGEDDRNIRFLAKVELLLQYLNEAKFHRYIGVRSFLKASAADKQRNKEENVGTPQPPPVHEL